MASIRSFLCCFFVIYVVITHFGRPTICVTSHEYLLQWMQKAKGTVAARRHTSKTMKAFFSDPINRQKRSIAMKGNFHTPAPVTG